MPVGFLSDNQARKYGRFPSELTPDQLARYFHLDDADHVFVASHRGDHNRLSVAVQLGSVRMLGIFLERPAPASAQCYIAHQLSIAEPEGLITDYARSEGRWRHLPRIRRHYGYRTYTDQGVAFRLNRFLYALCWTGSDRPSALFDRAVAWLLEAKVLLPGRSGLGRLLLYAATCRANSTSSTQRSARVYCQPTLFPKLPRGSISWHLAVFNRPLHELLSSRWMGERKNLHSSVKGSNDDRAGFLWFAHSITTLSGATIVNDRIGPDYDLQEIVKQPNSYPRAAGIA